MYTLRLYTFQILLLLKIGHIIITRGRGVSFSSSKFFFEYICFEEGVRREKRYSSNIYYQNSPFSQVLVYIPAQTDKYWSCFVYCFIKKSPIYIVHYISWGMQYNRKKNSLSLVGIFSINFVVSLKRLFHWYE